MNYKTITLLILVLSIIFLSACAPAEETTTDFVEEDAEQTATELVEEELTNELIDENDEVDIGELI